MAQKINSMHLFNNVTGSSRWGRGADGGNMKTEQQLKQTRDILPESCRHFSTHWIRQDKGNPTGGLMLTPILNLSFLSITKQGVLVSVMQTLVYSTVI